MTVVLVSPWPAPILLDMAGHRLLLQLAPLCLFCAAEALLACGAPRRGP